VPVSNCWFSDCPCSIVTFSVHWPVTVSDCQYSIMSNFLLARRSKHGICYGNLVGWVYVTCWYCIKTAKPILKLFRPSGSPIILVSYDHCADTQFEGEPLWGVKYMGVGKIGYFWRKSAFISETVRDRPMVTMEINRKSWVPVKNTNRKPYMIYWMVPFSMTLSDLWPRFQGHNIFWSRIS